MKFRIESADGSLAKDYRATAPGEFRNDLCSCTEELKYFVDGKQVTLAAAFDAADAQIAAAIANKEKTHKRIWVSEGASRAHNTFHPKWVRK